MKCNICKRNVRDSINDKLDHAIVYHFDLMLSKILSSDITVMARMFGEQVAEQIKAEFQRRIR